MKMEFTPIGTIRTPYEDLAPFRPDPKAKGEFSIIIDEQYQSALQGLEEFSHIIILFYFDRTKKTNIIVHPPHMHGRETGLFSSRSPNRINKIGMNIVKIHSIENNVITTSPMDVLNGTPLLDIKPYVPDLDCYPEASRGHTS
ncbi:MAG: tRNA (N6-threonylcarbamoyladenosine(37)-N6)-methyltransferase TrmO [Bacteroidales bacterium]|nr:tRNA (N6-threonylcarbamoyladenosine(37)-N6)-methyltransferase TrmO [Bacteroidales bacterium]